MTKILIEAQIGGDALRCSKMISLLYSLHVWWMWKNLPFPLCRFLYWGWACHIQGYSVLEHMKWVFIEVEYFNNNSLGVCCKGVGFGVGFRVLLFQHQKGLLWLFTWLGGYWIDPLNVYFVCKAKHLEFRIVLHSRDPLKYNIKMLV